MKRMSDKARARYSQAKPVRDGLRESVGLCEVCGSLPYFGNVAALDVHEISRGVHRQKSLDKLFALLVVCRLCHDKLGDAGQWPEARQLALLAERRLLDWDLQAYLELTNPRAPRRIEIEEVVAYMPDTLLKVEEVAGKMRVNRRTAQTWIDSGELPAIDVRPDGAQRSMWRVQRSDLLKFAQGRKSDNRSGRESQ
jgi:excisionase family DNA binding protein